LVAWTDSSDTSNPLVQVDDEASCTGDGWYFDDPNSPTQLTLCPVACAEVQSDSVAQVFVELGCPTTGYETTTHSDVYFAQCAGDSQAQWNFFAYTASVPTGTNIAFRARSANSEAELADASWVDLATATSAAPSCEMSDASAACPVVLYDLLGASSAKLEYLELEATLEPSSSLTPALQSWQVTFTCAPAE
jgi:hypothetical protein